MISPCAYPGPFLENRVYGPPGETLPVMAGLGIWLRPNADNDVVDTDGKNTLVAGVYTRLWDFSGNGNHFTGTIQEVTWQGVPGFKFNGISDLLYSPTNGGSTTPHYIIVGTVLIPYEYAAPQHDYAGLLSSAYSAGDDMFLWARNGGTPGSWYGVPGSGIANNATHYVNDGSAITATNEEPLTPKVLSAIKDYPYGWDRAVLGNDRNNGGRLSGSYIGDVVLYSTLLSKADHDLVSDYLATKYSI